MTAKFTNTKQNVILILIHCITLFRYGGNAKVVHFLGKTKPWSYTYDPKTKQIAGSVHEATTHPTFLLDWWSLYSNGVVPMLQEQYGDQPFQSGCIEVNEYKLLTFIYSIRRWEN